MQDYLQTLADDKENDPQVLSVPDWPVAQTVPDFADIVGDHHPLDPLGNPNTSSNASVGTAPIAKRLIAVKLGWMSSVH